jgi:hypothetical protein
MITTKRKTQEEFMRTRMPLGTLSLLAIWMVGTADAQITSNPIPEPIVKRGLAVEIKELVRLPDTRTLRPADQDVAPDSWARVSYVRDLPDGRRFANDSRGLLYLIDTGSGNNAQPHVYADVAAAFPFGTYKRLESGFIGFVFHPEFATNGLFYSVHSEIATGNPKIPDFIPIGYGLKDVTYHNVITEWHATNPAANTFEGTRREILRTAHVVANLTHPMGAVEFNPTAKRGDPDYGLLYTSGSDYGFSNGGGPNASNPAQTGSATTRFPWQTSSPPTATRRRWAKSTPMGSGMPIGFRGTPTERCSPPTSGWTTSKRSTSSAMARITAG